MKKDNDYFNMNEKTDFEKLVSFNNEKQFFNELYTTPEKHVYDASGMTNDDSPIAIELKSRNAVLTKEMTLSGHNFNDETVFIEDEKFTGLILQHIVNGAIPLYINFLEDGHILVWNLTKLKRLPVHKTVVINYIQCTIVKLSPHSVIENLYYRDKFGRHFLNIINRPFFKRLS